MDRSVSSCCFAVSGGERRRGRHLLPRGRVQLNEGLVEGGFSLRGEAVEESVGEEDDAGVAGAGRVVGWNDTVRDRAEVFGLLHA